MLSRYFFYKLVSFFVLNNGRVAGLTLHIGVHVGSGIVGSTFYSVASVFNIVGSIGSSTFDGSLSVLLRALRARSKSERSESG